MPDFFIICFLITMFSCNQNSYKNYQNIINTGWNTDSIISFEYNASDTLNPFQLAIHVRHNIDYEYQNLFVFVSGLISDTMEIKLANKLGKWQGAGLGDVRELEFIFKDSLFFPSKGKYTISFEQSMRYGSEEKIQNLQNILAVGLTIKNQNE